MSEIIYGKGEKPPKPTYNIIRPDGEAVAVTKECMEFVRDARTIMNAMYVSGLPIETVVIPEHIYTELVTVNVIKPYFGKEIVFYGEPAAVLVNNIAFSTYLAINKNAILDNMVIGGAKNITDGEGGVWYSYPESVGEYSYSAVQCPKCKKALSVCDCVPLYKYKKK